MKIKTNHRHHGRAEVSDALPRPSPQGAHIALLDANAAGSGAAALQCTERRRAQAYTVDVSRDGIATARCGGARFGS